MSHALLFDPSLGTAYVMGDDDAFLTPAPGSIVAGGDGVQYVIVAAAPSRAELERWSRKIRDYSAPANSGFDSLTDAERAKHGNSVDRWWQAIGKDNRVSSRASFAALKAEVPDYTIAQARDWWGRIGKDKRQKLRARHTKGYGDSFLGDIASVATKAVDLATGGPIARQIPGLRDVHGAMSKLQTLPLQGMVQIAQGQRIDRVAVQQFKGALGAAKTLAPYVQTIVAVVPGLGTGLAAGLGGALALASGQSIDQAMLAAVRSAIPGGALAQAAFDVTSSLVQGKPIDQVVLNMLPVDPTVKQAMLRTAQAARALADGKPVDQVLLDQAMRVLPPAAQKAAQIATAVAKAKNLQDAATRGARAMIPQATRQIAQQLPQLQRLAPALAPYGAKAAPALAMVQRAAQGEQRAKDIVTKIAKLASTGNPRGIALMQLLQTAYSALGVGAVSGCVSNALTGCASSGCGGGAAGSWHTTAGGSEVWVPNDPDAPLRAETGGPVFDFVADIFKPRVGYRGEGQSTFTMRDAYRSGLDAVGR